MDGVARVHKNRTFSFVPSLCKEMVLFAGEHRTQNVKSSVCVRITRSGWKHFICLVLVFILLGYVCIKLQENEFSGNHAVVLSQKVNKD